MRQHCPSCGEYSRGVVRFAPETDSLGHPNDDTEKALCESCLFREGEAFFNEIQQALARLKEEGRENCVGGTEREILEDRLFQASEGFGDSWATWLLGCYVMNRDSIDWQ